MIYGFLLLGNIECRLILRIGEVHGLLSAFDQELSFYQGIKLINFNLDFQRTGCMTSGYIRYRIIIKIKNQVYFKWIKSMLNFVQSIQTTSVNKSKFKCIRSFKGTTL